MAAINLRVGASTVLSNQQVDDNFKNLNNALGAAGSTTVPTPSGTGGPLLSISPTTTGTFSAANMTYSGTLTGSTAIIAIGTNQIYKDVLGNVGIGTSSPYSQLTVSGVGQLVAAITDAGSKLGTIYAYSPGQTAGDGGALLLGSHSTVGISTPQWAIKSLLTNGAGNGVGVLVFSGRATTADTSLTEYMRIGSSGGVSFGSSGTAYGTSGQVLTSAGTASPVWTNQSSITSGNVTTNANLSGAVTSVGNVTSLGSFTSLQLATALTGETGSGSVVFSASPTFTGTVNAAAITASGTVTINRLDGCYGNSQLSDSLAIGGGTLLSATTGSNGNTAVGQYSLSRLTIGYNNTAVGYQALYSNLSGLHNVAVGSTTLWNCKGSYNTAVGNSALESTISGTNNTAVGYAASWNNNNGSNNVSVGYSSAHSSYTGTNNTSLGTNAAFSNYSGSYNVSVGGSASYLNIEGVGNVALGYQALYTPEGNKNIGIGFNSGYYISTGINNVVIGGYTGATVPISYSESNNIVLSDGAGNVRAYYTNATSLWTIPNDMAIAGKFYKSQPAPTSLAGSNTVPITLTIANLVTYIIIATPITGTTVYNLPTGTLTDTGTSMDTYYCFDWSIMNNGAVPITLTAAVGHTLTVVGGGATLTAGAVGNYRTRKTAANTFITYRIG